MNLSNFLEQLKALGYNDAMLEGNRVKFTYQVMSGRFKDKTITMGFEIPQDFPLTPPSGPHISPRVLPLNPSAATHPERVAESPFGPEWEYWSRPFNDWQNTNKTVEAYMTRHIFHLFETQ
ncbi:Uncharacterised protein [uncultured archaeon]|nr:Uncharacterised protein [uncultured archaeon]